MWFDILIPGSKPRTEFPLLIKIPLRTYQKGKEHFERNLSLGDKKDILYAGSACPTDILLPFHEREGAGGGGGESLGGKVGWIYG